MVRLPAAYDGSPSRCTQQPYRYAFAYVCRNGCLLRRSRKSLLDCALLHLGCIVEHWMLQNGRHCCWYHGAGFPNQYICNCNKKRCKKDQGERERQLTKSAQRGDFFSLCRFLSNAHIRFSLTFTRKATIVL